jgi:serine-type D-Ala-D-Ala carboxypeptidase (penicillin-binding protein 5/6)
MPLSRRQILRRRRVTVFGGLAVVLGTAIYLPLTLLAPLDAATAQVAPYESPVQEALDLAFPEFGASAVGAIGFAGTFASSGDDTALPIASITKVITVLVVLDAKPLTENEQGPSIDITQADVALWNKQVAQNGSVAPVRAGITLTERQLMDLVLVKSANNYAETLVNWAFGSEKAYLPIARDWLKENALLNTSLADSTGFSPGNRATSTDLVELGKIALAHPVLAAIVDTETEIVPNIGAIENTNELLGSSGVRGIKTGTTDDAGACLLFAADYMVGEHPVTVVGVMLGGKTHPELNERIKKLLKSVKKSFHEVTLASDGQVFASYETEWGDETNAVAAETSTVLVWGQTPVTLLVDAEDLTTATSGSDAGELQFTVGTQTVVVPLELTATVDDPGPWWRLTNPAALF